jgi:hypothetical protein
VEPISVIFVGVVGGLLAGLLLLRVLPARPAPAGDRDDLAELLEVTNRRRRATGRPELTAADVARQIEGERG